MKPVGNIFFTGRLVAYGEYVVGVGECRPNLLVGSPFPEEFAVEVHFVVNKAVEFHRVWSRGGGEGRVLFLATVYRQKQANEGE